jgi:hypothetical protein
MVQLSSIPRVHVRLRCTGDGKRKGGKGGVVPSSMPYFSSSGRPVSLQVGKGTYCSSFFSFSICSPVSLSSHQISISVF